MEDNRGFPCLEIDEEDIDDENEEEWKSTSVNQTKRPLFGSCDQNSPAKKKLRTQLFGASDDVLLSVKGHERTIIHFDIDCFYAQVEMILNPSLYNKPVGIQQKHIVVTCNYVAREQGVSKLMRLSDAKKICPDLILVNGEDLTRYREFSKKVNDLLLGITPYVERLGFDENFLDVTGLVQARMQDSNDERSMLKPVGFVYGEKDTSEQTEKCKCGCHQRLAIGSLLASEFRELIFDQTGLTCCAGIAHNKILAKLAGECHKPNKQTVLFPENVNSFMQRLPARKIPGIGSSSAKRLQSIGVTSVLELQLCSLEAIQAEFGDGPLALTLKRLSYGIDDTEVVPSGSPKSISEEDTYHECSSVSEVTKKLKGLNEKLVSRLTDDLGTPQTVRLTIRRGIGELAGDRKESRQCPVPSKFSSPGLTKVNKNEILLNITLDLFKKLVNIKQPFKIKLLNVCLTKFQKSTKIGKNGLNDFFFSCKSNKPGCADSCISESESSLEKQLMKDTVENHEGITSKPLKTDVASTKISLGSYQQASSSSMKPYNELPEATDSHNKANDIEIPTTVDKEIFFSLPDELQKELMQEWKQLEQKRLQTKKYQKQTSPTGLLKYFSKK